MANYSDIKYQPAGSATTTYSDMAALIAATGMSAGDQALVTALNKVFMYTGSAWYLVATMTNDSPTAITGVDGTYTLATDGTATTVTVASTDPEGFPLTFSHAVTAGSLSNGGGATATVSQGTGANSNVFTITPSTTEAYAGAFSITFSVTDGATGAVNAVSAFTLAFTPPLPTSGLVALYDMNDTNSYSGSGSTWSDVSGNSGPDLTIDTSKATYNSSGIGGIPSISLDTDTRLPTIKTGTGTYHFQGQSGSYVGGSNPNAGLLVSSVYPGAGTVVMIYSRPSSNTQTSGYVMSAQTSQGAALVFGSSTSSSALKTGSSGTGYWFHNAAQTSAKFYIDKVEQTSMTEKQFYDFLVDSNNQNKYHSITLTDGHFWNGWTSSNIHPNFPTSSLQGEIRALVFYNRVLTSAEIDDVHDHFAGDYTSSEMA